MGRRVLVCGGRGELQSHRRWELYRTLDTMHARDPITVVIHGGASGIDSEAGTWAHDRKVPAIRFVADWTKYGRKAGPIRNARMLHEGKPDLVLAFPGNRGTEDMKHQANERGVEVLDVTWER